jgi:hypothetical protein
LNGEIANYREQRASRHQEGQTERPGTENAGTGWGSGHGLDGRSYLERYGVWLGRNGFAVRRESFKIELRNVGACREFDAYLGRNAEALGILGQPLAHLGSFDPDHGVVGGVVVDGAAEHLCAQHSLTQTVESARQGMVDDQLEEILSTLAASEGITGEDVLKSSADGGRALDVE